ncbi:hypothetical protein GW17_00033926 [Ensete ventricosum]|nr:hypothetical protein GW17_00033926 [Ensete ventricosum]
MVGEEDAIPFHRIQYRRPLSPKKSQQGETSDRRDDPQEHGHIISNPNTSRMKVDFPRWEEGDSIGWITRAERYFRFSQTVDATRVEIATIHLEGDAIQWFNWYEHTHGARYSRRSKDAITIHSYGGDLLRENPRRTIKPRSTKDKGRSPISHAEALNPLYMPRLRTYPFHLEKKVLMLHDVEFRSRLGMGMNTLSSVYKPLYEYRSLRVSNSPHLCEFCITLIVIERHIPLYMVSSFTKRSALP